MPPESVGSRDGTLSRGPIYGIHIPQSRYKPTDKAAAAAYYNDMLQVFQGLAAVTNSAPGNPHLILTILTSSSSHPHLIVPGAVGGGGTPRQPPPPPICAKTDDAAFSPAPIKLGFWTSVPICSGGVCSTETSCLKGTLQLIKQHRDDIDRLIVGSGLAVTIDGDVVCTDCGKTHPLEANIQSWLPAMRTALSGSATPTEIILSLDVSTQFTGCL